MTDTWCLDVLPSEVLILIFDYCDIYDLLRLSEVCKRFYDIVRTDVLWVKKRKTFLVTNQISERFRKRCFEILQQHVTWGVSYNWHYGIYKRETVFNTKEVIRMMPKLKMTNDMIWWTAGNQFFGALRQEGSLSDVIMSGRFSTKSYIRDYSTKSDTGGDICSFVIWKDFIICGHMNGTINYFSMNSKMFKQHIVKTFPKDSGGQRDVDAMDVTSENVIIGLRDKVKIRRHPDMDVPEKIVYDERQIHIPLKDSVKSLSIDPTEVKFAVGSTGITDVPLRIINIERYTMIDTMQHEWKYGAGILDMVWEDPNTLLTCGYDTYIRKWDLRTGRCVRSWMDPNDAALYCISSDYQYTMVTGTQYNCLAVLWDQRKNDFVQLYYVNSRASSRRSPIYSLQFDSTHMYCATDKHVIELNFLVRKSRKFDYKSLYTPLCMYQ